jgi:shikimate kinase
MATTDNKTTNVVDNNQTNETANVIMIGGIAIAPKAIECNPLARKERAQKQGVIWAIGEILKAHASTGITKARILEYIAAMYPDRKVESLAQTITVQVPSRLTSDRNFVIESKDLPDGQRLYFYRGLKNEEAKK